MRIPARKSSISLGLACALLVPGVLPAQAADPFQPVQVASYDFESGSQGWFARGGATVAISTESARGGSQGLRTSGRTQNWEGPGVELAGVLQTGATYTVSAYARLAAGSPSATVNATMQRSPTGGSTTYDYVAGGTVTDAAWAQLSGSYTVPSDSSGLQLYLESSDVTASWDLDDVTVTMTVPPPTGPPGTGTISSDFEDGGAQGWIARGGSESVAVSTADAHSGTHSLLASGRSQTWQGPALNVLGRMTFGARYSLQAWVKLAAGQPAEDLRLSVERQLSGTASYDTVVGNTRVSADGWVKLAGTYTLSNNVDFLAVYLETASGTPDFYLDDVTIAYLPELPVQTAIPSLKDVFAGQFEVGAAVVPSQLYGSHAELLTKHFSSITPGNALKWDATEPQQGQFWFTDADPLVDFAVAHGLKIRGHTLTWHSQTPAWVFQHPDGTPLTATPEDKALLLQRQTDHIKAVVGRYAGKIYAWDVVNEVIDENQSDGLRRSPWYQITGLDYLRNAFRVAHQVDPAAKLYINDYNTEQPAKREALFKVVSRLRSEGIPIDGVGHQLHVNIEQPSAAQIEATIERFAATGLDQQVTELDVSVYPNNSDSYAAVPDQVLVEQGYRYKEIFDVFRRHAAQLSSVTTWGIADDETWLSTFPITRLNAPLLFDDRLQAKPAYWGVVDPSRLAPRQRTLTVPQAAIRVDGVPEPEWQLLPATTITSPGGASASFSVRWSAAGVSVLADVADRTADRGDHLDVYLDGGRTRLARIGAQPPGVRAVSVRTRTGYRIEATIPRAPVPAAGAAVPFDLRVSDAHRPAETVSWNDATNGQDTDAGHAGRLVLVPAVGRVEARRGTPTIDGVADRSWAKVPAISTNVQVSGTGGATATAKLSWDAGHLYVLATVTDPTLDATSPNSYEQDSVEIFVDPHNAKTGGYPDDAGQYRVNYLNARSVSGNFDAYLVGDNLTSATRVVPGGYVVEAAIRLNTLDPCRGDLLGFDLQVNDATAGARTAARSWNDPTGLSYLSPARWGVVRLG